MTFIRQCPKCLVIVDDIGKNRARRVPSIVTLKQLEQVTCYPCQEKEKIITNTKDHGEKTTKKSGAGRARKRSE